MKRTPLRSRPTSDCRSCASAGRTICIHGPGPKSRTPLRSKPRPESETLRIYGPPERRRWIRQQPSVVSGQTPCVNAHVPPDGDLSGMGRKADYIWIVPMTYEEHEELHRVGIETFERVHDIDLRLAAAAIEERWETMQRAREAS